MRDERDCLAIFRQRVTEAGLLEAAQLDEIDREIGARIDRSVTDAKARAAAQPTPTCDRRLRQVLSPRRETNRR